MYRPERSAQRQIHRQRGLDAGNSSAYLRTAAAQRSAAVKLRGSHRAQGAVDGDACQRLRLLRRFLSQHRLRELSRAAASAVLHDTQRQVAELPVADQGELTPETALFKCPFPNVNGFSLCVGSNVFTGYDTPRKLRTLLHRVMAVPFGDDYYRTEQTRLNLGARELFEHLKDKTPAYYYENVLIASGKTLSDFLGGAA